MCFHLVFLYLRTELYFLLLMEKRFVCFLHFPCLVNIVRLCRNISSESYGTFFIFSVKLTLAMEIIGFSVRLSSSFLWIQIYRLGVSYVDTSFHRETDFDLRNSFLSPTTPAVVRQSSSPDEALGGSIYDPAYFSSLFEDGRENRYLVGV